MSHSIESQYEVYDEHHVKARKAHACGACGDEIAPGHMYWRIGIIWEGEAETVKRCERCQAIHLHLRELDYGVLWPDERLGCGIAYEEHWGGPPPPWIAELAFVTAGQMQQRLCGMALLAASFAVPLEIL